MASSRIPADIGIDNEAGGSAPTQTTGTPTNTNNPGRGGRGRGRGKRTSEIWNDFDLVVEYDDDGNAVEHGVCKNANIHTTLPTVTGQIICGDTFLNVPTEVLILTPLNQPYIRRSKVTWEHSLTMPCGLEKHTLGTWRLHNFP